MAAATFTLAIITFIFFTARDNCSNSRSDSYQSRSRSDSDCDSGYTNNSTDNLAAETKPLLISSSHTDLTKWKKYGDATV